MNRAFLKATFHDLDRLSAEERRIYQEIVDLMVADGMTQLEAEHQAYLSFFTK